MNVLVTGSSGFIGGHLVRALVDRGDRVVGLDHRPPAIPLPGVDYLTVDLLDRDALIAALTRQRPERLVHLAARTDVEETRSLRAYDANITGVTNLLDAVAAAGTVRRAVYTSTQLVCPLGYLPTSETDYCPDTLYGQSKVETERRVRSADGGTAATWCLIRPTTIWGPEMNSRYLPFFELVARGRYWHITNAPLCKSYGYVGNTVHQILRLLVAPVNDIHRRMFYLADYEPLSIRRWAEAFRLRMHAPKIRTMPRWLAVTAASAGSAAWVAGWKSVPLTRYRLHNMLTEYLYDVSATAAVCGPLPYSFDDGVDATWQWLQSLGIGARHTPADDSDGTARR